MGNRIRAGQFETNAAARYLGIHRETILKAYRAGKIRGTKDTLRPGSPVMFTKEDLDAYRERKTVTSGN